MSSCLQLNTEFSAQFSSNNSGVGSSIDQTPPAKADSDEPDGTTTFMEGVVSQHPSERTTSASLTSTEVSTPSTNATNGSDLQQTGSSSNPPQTSSSSPPPLMARHEIKVVNQSSSTSIDAGYAVSLEIDHAAFVMAGFRADGTDLAIVSNVGGVDSNVARTLDPSSAWGQGQTKLWFALPQAISAGQSTRNRYYLVLGDERFPGVDQPKQVFLAYDSFDGTTLDTTIWSVSASTDAGSSGQDVANGQLRLWSHGQGTGSYSQIQSKSAWQMPGVRLEAQIAARGGATAGAPGCSRERILAAWSKIDNKVRGAVTQTQTSLYFESIRDPSTNQIHTIGGVTPDTNSHRFVINWQDETQQLYRDQAHLGNFTGPGTYRSPDSTSMLIGMSTSAFGGTCAGLVSELVVDWILARPLTTPEPTASVVIAP